MDNLQVASFKERFPLYLYDKLQIDVEGMFDTSSGKFDAKHLPSMHIVDYTKRIIKYGGFSIGTLACALTYLDKMIQLGVKYTPMNCHRLIISLCIISAKKCDDLYYNNMYYCRMGGLELRDMNRCELDALNLIGWELYFTVDSIKEAINKVLKTSLPTTTYNTAPPPLRCVHHPILPGIKPILVPH